MTVWRARKRACSTKQHQQRHGSLSVADAPARKNRVKLIAFKCDLMIIATIKTEYRLNITLSGSLPTTTLPLFVICPIYRQQLMFSPGREPMHARLWEKIHKSSCCRSPTPTKPSLLPNDMRKYRSVNFLGQNYTCLHFWLKDSSVFSLVAALCLDIQILFEIDTTPRQSNSGCVLLCPMTKEATRRR